MNKQAMELLDLGMLILVLGLIISLGLSTLYKTHREVVMNDSKFMEDKNTGRNRGYLINEYGSFDGTLSKIQVILLSQIQDSNMPLPRKVLFNGSNIELPVWYKEYRFDCGQNIWEVIKNDSNANRYILEYEFKLDDKGVIIDEYYTINVMN